MKLKQKPGEENLLTTNLAIIFCMNIFLIEKSLIFLSIGKPESETNEQKYLFFVFKYLIFKNTAFDHKTDIPAVIFLNKIFPAARTVPS